MNGATKRIGERTRCEGLGYGRQASRLSGQTAVPAVRQARAPSAGQAGRLSSGHLRGDSPTLMTQTNE
jgi:hypothetical protein